jgi:diketogulonate reductase-like aldo/keto reductase
MKTTVEEVSSWIRREQKKKQPNQIYIRWLEQQRIKMTVTAENKHEIHRNNTNTGRHL